MSIKMMNLAWKLPLNSTETLVILALADAASDEGFCFPGYENLIEKTKLARATLAKTLGILEGTGIFEKKPHSNIGEGRKVNTYQLLFNESWFHVVTNPPKSSRIELIESIRIELIERIKELRENQKRPISSTLSRRKVQPSDTISSIREHEPSYNHHTEPSLNKYKGEKPADKVDKKQPKVSKTTATRLSANWEPSPQDISFCVSIRPDLSVNDVADEFKDYWIAVPGAKGKKEDWPATWRNWVRKQFVKPGVSAIKQQSAKQSRMSLAGIDYNEGVNPDGSF